MARTRNNRTTLTQVAREAGVSTATASMVLSGKSEDVRIALATADRVRAAALELDYSPNLLVHSLQRGTSKVLAFFSAFRNLADDDAYMDILSRALEQAAGRRGYDLLIHCAFERSVDETYRSINGGRADGLLLFAPHRDDPMLPMMRRSRLPCVVLNARDPEGTLPSVKDDFEHGMRLVGEALVSHGHRRIACVHVGPDATPDAAERIAALDRTLATHGIERPVPWTVNGQGRPHLGVESLLTGGDAPTAIFCSTDRLAYTVVDILERLGLQVPRDVSVVGYDGIRWPSETRHRVATVAVDLKTQARVAVDRLIDGPAAPREATVPTIFQPGTTLGPARNDATEQ